MAVVCPAILAESEHQYRSEIEKIARFAHRIQVDLTDGEFAAHRTVDAREIWWPAGIKADIHLMFKNPTDVLHQVLRHQPHLVIAHAEAEGDFEVFAKTCHEHGARAGVALLPETQPEQILPALGHIDHVLIFSGSLGEYGGHADLDLLDKVRTFKQHSPKLEIGWDGGINDQNIAHLVFGGVDVLNVGGYIQHSPDPHRAYLALERIASETGTT